MSEAQVENWQELAMWLMVPIVLASIMALASKAVPWLPYRAAAFVAVIIGPIIAFLAPTALCIAECAKLTVVASTALVLYVPLFLIMVLAVFAKRSVRSADTG